MLMILLMYDWYISDWVGCLSGYSDTLLSTFYSSSLYVHKHTWTVSQKVRKSGIYLNWTAQGSFISTHHLYDQMLIHPKSFSFLTEAAGYQVTKEVLYFTWLGWSCPHLTGSLIAIHKVEFQLLGNFTSSKKLAQKNLGNPQLPEGKQKAECTIIYDTL